MKKFAPFLLAGLLVTAGCTKESTEPTVEETAVEQIAAKTYDLTGTIVSLDEAAKVITIDHGPIGDWMDAMTMPFPVRGADFAALPPKGAHIKATVHVAESGDYWITDVVEAPAEEPVTGEPAEGTPTEEAPADAGAGPAQEVSL